MYLNQSLEHSICKTKRTKSLSFIVVTGYKLLQDRYKNISCSWLGRKP